MSPDGHDEMPLGIDLSQTLAQSPHQCINRLFRDSLSG